MDQMYNDIMELLQNEEKQYKIKGELSKWVCITLMFIAISVLTALPFLFLHLVFPM